MIEGTPHDSVGDQLFAIRQEQARRSRGPDVTLHRSKASAFTNNHQGCLTADQVRRCANRVIDTLQAEGVLR